ncbi:hypothetical protein [Deinococcus misasensis]|uniref:hypothetical protein n=1 Tax=Deinococcus misasensis TaxID=392413 RepID=UPI000A657216|nr:hypothetical protein [Deinococcus misasensis]
MKIEVELGKAELEMLTEIRDLIRENNGSSPKTRHVRGKSGMCGHERLNATFERLKAFGLVDHSINGHCRLSPAGMEALQRYEHQQVHWVDARAWMSEAMDLLSNYNRIHRKPIKEFSDRAENLIKKHRAMTAPPQEDHAKPAV